MLSGETTYTDLVDEVFLPGARNWSKICEARSEMHTFLRSYVTALVIIKYGRDILTMALCGMVHAPFSCAARNLQCTETPF